MLEEALEGMLPNSTLATSDGNSPTWLLPPKDAMLQNGPTFFRCVRRARGGMSIGCEGGYLGWSWHAPISSHISPQPLSLKHARRTINDSCRGTLDILLGTKASGNNDGYLPCTFFNPRGLTKGRVWVNGFDLGWYWPAAGYQVNLYVPGSVLREGTNDVVVLEVEAAPSEPRVSLDDQPDWSGPVAFSNSVA